ncbi:MAG TPA: metal-dependent hydrolase [Dongiaceae bacterium]|nr:metal-dependent hydrolase [Dongiaceae bacterium]
MAPATHLFLSWVIAAKTTDNPRDCRLVTLAGILPDLDGLGLGPDLLNQALGRPATHFYLNYHHFLLHGLAGGLLIAGVLAAFAQRRWRVALLALALFHLHLLCDLAGSRGPDPDDLWPIFYFGPFHKDPMWLWTGQWPLNAWPLQVSTVLLFGWSLGLAVKRGDSVVGVFNRRLDRTFVAVLRQWQLALSRKGWWPAWNQELQS